MQEHAEAEYSQRVTLAVMQAILALDGDGSGHGGWVGPTAIDGLCDTIAAFMFEAGEAETLRDKKKAADYCRARIFLGLKLMEEFKAKGIPLPWFGDTSRTRGVNQAAMQ